MIILRMIDKVLDSWNWFKPPLGPLGNKKRDE
jgi:hypothetical protein